ncbi:MAG: FIST signal transduction protein [Elainellaceae cyanobacterium]
MAQSMTDQMKWVSALSTQPSLEAAIHDVVEHAQQSLQAPADLGLVFISSAFASEYSRLMPLLKEKLEVSVLIGCSGGGVVGMNTVDQSEEIEGGAALSLTVAHLPGVTVTPFHVTDDELPDLDGPPDRWIDLMGVSPNEHPDFIVLSDPTFSKVVDLLQGLDFAYPGSVKVGGLASGGALRGGIGLFYNDRMYEDGMVGIALSGDVTLEAIVAQGCRPIGGIYQVVEGDRNIILKLEEQIRDDVCGIAQTPLEVLQALIQDLSEDDRELAQHSLFVGIAQTEFKRELDQGDFLIRNLIGVDPRIGAIAVGDRIRPGQRIQFHLRDAATSADDLEGLLKHYQYTDQTRTTSPIGALMFSCMGRGERLYNEQNFDSRLFSHYVSNVPVAGFFCNGEIGPVGDTTFIHGYTSVFGIIRQAAS